MPQGSTLGPVFFNIFLSDLLLIIKDTDFASYADDNTIYKAGSNIDEVIAYYNSHPKSSSTGFQIIRWKQTCKWNFIISSNDSSEIKIGNSLMKNSNYEKPQGVKVDNKLTFDDHVKDMCRKANSKLGALGRITPYMGLGKKKFLMNSCFAA